MKYAIRIVRFSVERTRKILKKKLSDLINSFNEKFSKLNHFQCVDFSDKDQHRD